MERRSQSLILRWLLLLGGFAEAEGVQAQRLSGAFERPFTADKVVLFATRGMDHPALDSVRIDEDGRFAFPERTYPAGFYQLGVNDSDRVDIILDPHEPAVELAFKGIPLQLGLQVLSSSENQRMWAYKGISKAGQETITAIQHDRSFTSPLDTGALRSLDRREAAVRQSLDNALDSLISIEPDRQFAYAVVADRKLDAAIPGGPAALLKAFDMSDPRLLRSTSYAKAMVYYLQSTPLTTESGLLRSCDSLLHAASRDTVCWSYARKHLVELFTTYGPDDVAQYLVDHYVVGPGSLVPPDRALLIIAAEQLRLVPGAPAPDMILVNPGSADTLRLSAVLPQHAYTGLFFYSSTCDHCHDQMPGLRQLVTDMDPRFFHLIGIALDASVEEFTTTLTEKGVNWPCYTELKGWGVQGAKDFGVKATPTLFLLDRAGRIAAKPADHEGMRAFLEARKR